MLQCAIVCRSVMPCVAVRCVILQGVAGCCNVCHCIAASTRAPPKLANPSYLVAPRQTHAEPAARLWIHKCVYVYIIYFDFSSNCSVVSRTGRARHSCVNSFVVVCKFCGWYFFVFVCIVLLCRTMGTQDMLPVYPCMRMRYSTHITRMHESLHACG